MREVYIQSAGFGGRVFARRVALDRSEVEESKSKGRGDALRLRLRSPVGRLTVAARMVDCGSKAKEFAANRCPFQSRDR